MDLGHDIISRCVKHIRSEVKSRAAASVRTLFVCTQEAQRLLSTKSCDDDVDTKLTSALCPLTRGLREER